MTLLYVEDEPNDVFFMRHALQESGLPHALQAVANGQQAIDYLAGTGDFANRAQYPLPALVLLDLNLPLVPGLDVLRWIRQQPQFRSLPVVVFSASELERDNETARLLGANEYIIKPLDMGMLPPMLQSLDARWMQR